MPPCLAPIWKPEESVKSSGIEGIVGLVLEIEYGFFQRAASASNVLKISLAPGTCFLKAFSVSISIRKIIC